MLCARQVAHVSKRKVVLFIVEGITDRTAIALAVSRLLEKQNVEFAVVHGDITANLQSNPGNIARKVCDVVKRFSSRIYRPSDFAEIVHLIDLDGAFVSDTCVYDAKAVKGKLLLEPLPYYTDHGIYCNDIRGICDRNRRKQANIKKLLGMHTIWRIIPYSMYYFSCNLEHVLYDKANVLDKDKYCLAVAFEDRFARNPWGFQQFFRQDVVAAPGNYTDSWNFIEEGNNSLKRYCNFGLWLSNF